MMRKLIMAVTACIASLAAAAQIVPQPLPQGSKIAVVTPSSWVDSLKTELGMETLRSWGYEPVPMQHVFGNNWRGYSATDAERAADLMEAFSNPEYAAIFCSRGGYGSTRLLPLLDPEVVRANPKWLIGFSDISALHAFMTKAGVASIHGPMSGHVGQHPDDQSSAYLLQLLQQGLPLRYELAADSLNHDGKACGTVVGGNFIVVNNLAQTPWDVFDLSDGSDAIIFVEEVGEKIYAVERMLLRLHQSGTLGRAKGLIFGEFTNYKPDEDFKTMEEMLSYWLREWGYYDRPDFPIVFRFPAGHGDACYPVVLGAKATLESADGVVKLSFE